MGIKEIGRRDLIRKILEENGTVSVSSLAKKLKTSTATIRRDLEKLEKEGLLLRTYGGATKQTIPSEFFYQKKAVRNLAEKKEIASKATELIKEGDTIFLDTGTTTLEIARLLKEVSFSIVVVTNSFTIIEQLLPYSQIKVFSIGGFLRRELLDFYGPFSLKQLERLSIDKAFLGVDGISATAGLTTTDMETASIEEAIMDISKNVTVVADYSKIGRISLISYASLGKIDILITDKKASKHELEGLEKAGIKVIIA